MNGSFEDPAIAGSFQLFSSIPEWMPTGSCGNIEIDRGVFGAAADGKQCQGHGSLVDQGPLYNSTLP